MAQEASKTPVLIDPWLIEQTDDWGETADKLSALATFLVECRERRLVPAACIEPECMNAFQSWFNGLSCEHQRKHRVTVARLNCLFHGKETGDEAEVVDALDLPSAWRRSLWDTISPDDLTRWREPLIFIPEARKGQWPQVPEVTIRAHGENDFRRVLAVIEELDQHPFLNYYFDPWIRKTECDPDRCFPSGSDDDQAIGQQAQPNLSHPCCLPRPPWLASTEPVSNWRAVLDANRTKWRETIAHDVERWYFLPPSDWNPSAQSLRHEHWRSRSCFKTKSKNGQSGPIDQNDRIWVWDIGEHHWDVQHRSEKRPKDYWSVSHNGRLLKKVEKGKRVDSYPDPTGSQYATCRRKRSGK